MLAVRVDARIAAPMATTSSGFKWSRGELPNTSATRRRTRGILVGSSDENDPVEGGHGLVCDEQRFLAHGECPLDEGRGDRLELRAGEHELEFSRRPCLRSERYGPERHGCPFLRGQINLEVLGRHPKPLECLQIATQILAISALEYLCHALREDQIDVVASKKRIPSGS